MSWEDLRQLEDSARLKAEILSKRERWGQGKLPSELFDREVTMHARSFVYAIDGVWKSLEVLAKSPIPNEAGKAVAALKSLLPDVIDVRDTTHHMEDRVRGLNRHEKPLDLQPVDNSLVQAPGGVLVLNSLNGDVYTCTMNNGGLGEVPVNDQTLTALQSAVQQTIDSISWRGPARHSPMDL